MLIVRTSRGTSAQKGSAMEEARSGNCILHMGQFPQDGENGPNVAFVKKNWSSAVTKRFDFFNISQLF